MINGYMVDISDPQTYNYTGTSVIPNSQRYLPRCSAFYLGGNTPHVWSPEQIDTQTNRYRLPIWVYDPAHTGAANGTADAKKAIQRLVNLGAPKGIRVVYDMETWVDKEWSNAFCETIEADGYLGTAYGSKNTIIQNHIGKGGLWDADYGDGVTVRIHINQGSWATQYADSKMLKTNFDMSALSDTSHLWDMSAAPPPQTPVPVSMSLHVTYSDSSVKVTDLKF